MSVHTLVRRCSSRIGAAALALALGLGGAAGTARADDGFCPAVLPFGGFGWVCTGGPDDCEPGCSCRTISLAPFWSDCRCIRNIIPRGTGCHWGARRDVVCATPLTPNSTVGFQMIAAPGDVLDIFDGADIQPDGSVAAFTRVPGPNDLSGGGQFRVGSGPPNAIPIEIIALNLTSPGAVIGGVPTGVITLTLDPLGPPVQGVWDATAGTVFWGTSMSGRVSWAQYPGGLPCKFGGGMSGNPGFGSVQFSFRGTGATPLPAAAVPVLSARGLAVLATILVVGGVLVLRRR